MTDQGSQPASSDGLLRVIHLLSILGRELHFHVPGTDAYAGYLMAASGFLALAHTFNADLCLLLTPPDSSGAASLVFTPRVRPAVSTNVADPLPSPQPVRGPFELGVYPKAQKE